jgi:hypothetical protein
MIISAGMRTDIPAFFSDWFYNRIREGFVCVRNPYYPEQVTRYLLNPDVVDCIHFCTKNPQPMEARLDEIVQFRQYWSVTITPYGRDIEPQVPDKAKVIASFQRISSKVGARAMSWRYDPIFITDKYNVEFHIQSFEKMAAQLSGYTEQCVISFIDLYTKTRRNFPLAKKVSQADQLMLGKAFAEIGQKYQIKIHSCCEGSTLAPFGIDTSGCLTQSVLEHALGESLVIPKNKKSQRPECNCLLGSDIGAYNTCAHGCLYCYANFNQALVHENLAQHDPLSPFLIGNARPNDILKKAKQESYIDSQLSLF